MNGPAGGTITRKRSPAPAMTAVQQARARQLVELYKQGDTADPLANAIQSVGNLAHRATQATHTTGPARAIAHALEQPGYVALKTAETLHKANQDWEQAAQGEYRFLQAFAADENGLFTDPAVRRALWAASKRHDLPAALRVTYPRSSAILAQAVNPRHFASEIRHPLRHPGYTFLDVAGATGAAGLLGSRLAAAGRAAALPEEAPIVEAATTLRPLAGKNIIALPTRDITGSPNLIVGRAGGSPFDRLARAGRAYVRRDPAVPRQLTPRGQFPVSASELAALAVSRLRRVADRGSERFQQEQHQRKAIAAALAAGSPFESLQFPPQRRKSR